MYIYMYTNMHVHACLHVLTYSRRFILWKGTVIIRFRVLPSGSSLMARVFNPLLLLFIIEPLSTHVLAQSMPSTHALAYWIRKET